jgi:hypothetical protein
VPDPQQTEADPLELPPESPQPTTLPRRRNGRGSSKASSAVDPFFADRGPAFDPGAEVPEDEAYVAPEPGELPEIVLWTPERVRRVLTLQGTLTHAVAGVAERDWLWQPNELDMVCGPLAEHCNRVPVLAALAHLSDDAAIAAGFVSYAVRSWLERTRELQARRSLTPEPATGRTADPPIDPEGTEWNTPT